jgi:hypothetical protein
MFDLHKSECPGGAGQVANQTESPPNSIKTACFLGTINKRHLRAIQALLVSPQPREAIDSRAGCSNGPDLIAELRRRGLEIPCQRTPCIDRDGFEVKRGIYYLTERDKRLIRRWKNSRKQGGAQS